MNDAVLRSRIRNLSRQRNIPSHLLLQNYFLERLLVRISLSDYKDDIILKGGLLISSLIGIEKRTTMDMDVSIKNMLVQETKVIEMIKDILEINMDDEIRFEFVDIREIRQIDEYYGYRIRIIANFGKIKQSLSIDISTGDVITPEQISYQYKKLIEEGTIEIKTYNIESILAEKIETIITRGTLNTRMRDYYDVYMLLMLKKTDIERDTLKKAINNTFLNRESMDLLEIRSEIIDQIRKSDEMKNLWKLYCNKNSYVGAINFLDTIELLEERLAELF